MIELMLKTATLPVVIFALAVGAWLIIRGLYRDRPVSQIMTPEQFYELVAFNTGRLDQYECYEAGGSVVERTFMGRVR